MGNRAKIARALTSRWTERIFFVLLLAAVALRNDAVWRVVSGAFVVWVMCALWAVAPTLRKPARGGAAAQDAAGLKTAESEHDDKKEINKE
ncbi:hypothetical protein [Alistipes putredinis]|jgi:hypothetical protein|uniref:hypothetical protein n=1 Tax=Alistipes putredinis TaxID=28117 RepID=UPI00242AC200|nr:hypothetical protein [Alistipes putredinis]